MDYNKTQLEILIKMTENGDKESTKLLLNYYYNKAVKSNNPEDIENYFTCSYLYIYQNSFHFVSKEINPIFYAGAVKTQNKLIEEFGTYDIDKFNSNKNEYITNFINYQNKNLSDVKIDFSNDVQEHSK